jgi:hypothetical protein
MSKRLIWCLVGALGLSFIASMILISVINDASAQAAPGHTAAAVKEITPVILPPKLAEPVLRPPVPYESAVVETKSAAGEAQDVRDLVIKLQADLLKKYEEKIAALEKEVTALKERLAEVQP